MSKSVGLERRKWPNPLLDNDRFRPILLKNSAMAFMAVKYTLEIETLTLSKGFRTQISRSGAQKATLLAVSMQAVRKN